MQARVIYAATAVVLCVLPSFSSIARAQSTVTGQGAVVSVHVVDEAGKPLEGVTVAIVTTDSTGDEVATRYLVTDAAGRVSPTLAVSAVPYGYSARKLGFARAHGTIIVSAADGIPVEIRLTRVAQGLDTVRTLANQRILMTNYTLGSAEIARSHQHILNAADAIRYLRPTLIGLGPLWSGCPYVKNLWVNGQLQPLGPLQSFTPVALSTARARNDGSGRPALTAKPNLLPHTTPDVPLAMIQPEYISEMRYVDCHHPEFGNNGENALYVSLKPGVAFDIKHGTYVADTTAARAAHVIP